MHSVVARFLKLIAIVALIANTSWVGPAGATGNVVLTDGQVLTSSIYATTISLPSGATAYFAESIVLSATQSIRIDGQLRDVAPKRPDIMS